jgi:GLPGLI family protein
MKLFLILLSILFCNTVFAQQDNVLGYIEYTRSSETSNTQTIQMWFTKTSCLSILTPASARTWPAFAHKKYFSISDSLNDDKKIKVLDSSLMKNPTNITYRNIQDAFFIRSYIINGKKYCVYDTIASRSWQLKSDTQTIAGFKCLKADFTFSSGERGYVWYTPDIPLPFGPETLYGLPGLIVEVGSYDIPYKISVQKIQIPYYETVNMQPCLHSKLITRGEYNKLIQEANQNMEKMLQKQKNEGN